MDTTHLFTRLYVNGAMPELELRERVSRALRGVLERNTVVAADVSVDVRRSKESDPAAVERDPRDYIRYPYSVEVEAREGAPLSWYLETVAAVMRCLREMGGDVVASCDWEDELPGAGSLGPAFGR